MEENLSCLGVYFVLYYFSFSGVFFFGWLQGGQGSPLFLHGIRDFQLLYPKAIEENM